MKQEAVKLFYHISREAALVWFCSETVVIVLQHGEVLLEGLKAFLRGNDRSPDLKTVTGLSDLLLSARTYFSMSTYLSSTTKM